MANEQSRIDLTWMSPTIRATYLKEKHEDIEGGKQVLILAIPNPKKPIFEVECEGRIRNVPIDHFIWWSVSYEISEFFPDWNPCSKPKID